LRRSGKKRIRRFVPQNNSVSVPANVYKAGLACADFEAAFLYPALEFTLDQFQKEPQYSVA
jgi:hypothetical protein